MVACVASLLSPQAGALNMSPSQTCLLKETVSVCLCVYMCMCMCMCVYVHSLIEDSNCGFRQVVRPALLLHSHIRAHRHIRQEEVLPWQPAGLLLLLLLLLQRKSLMKQKSGGREGVYVCNRLSVEVCVWKQQEDHRSVPYRVLYGGWGMRDPGGGICMVGQQQRLYVSSAGRNPPQK